MITARIKGMLEACEDGDPSFPPNVLFNENWLLRIVLDWFSGHDGDPHPFAPTAGARWFSEAWLPSAFLPRYRGDHFAEARTRADGVVGHFGIGDPGRAALGLKPEARQFVVIEAKLYNRLSAGVKNAPEYDQAARTVACIAETLRRAGRDPEDVEGLSFVVAAPASRIDDGAFAWEMMAESIRRKVRNRIADYEGDRDGWFAEWFEPTLAKIDLISLSWEDVFEFIELHDPISAQKIDSFYGRCLRHNRPRSQALFPGRRGRAGLPCVPGSPRRP